MIEKLIGNGTERTLVCDFRLSRVKHGFNSREVKKHGGNGTEQTLVCDFRLSRVKHGFNSREVKKHGGNGNYPVSNTGSIVEKLKSTAVTGFEPVSTE